MQSNFTNYTSQDNKQEWREYPRPQAIDFLMIQWIDAVNSSLSRAHNQEEAAYAYADLHLNFVTIRPFFDGNGRMARLLANLPVLKSGLPPIVVPQEDRYQYKVCLSAYQTTVADLAELHNLAQLPAVFEKQHFVELCTGYWSQTIDLLNKAHEVQSKRLG